MARLGAIVVAVLIAAVVIPANGDFIDSLQSVVNDAAKIAKSMCITHDNCYKDVFTLNNYCCLKKMGTCCNMFDFVFSGGDEKDVWNNFVSTFQDPRPINIVIIVLLLLAVFAVVSMLLSLIGYFFCGCARICCCCGQRKYTIVNH